MARADILISLVKAASRGDLVSFKKATESLIAEEREKKHHILADRLAASLKANGVKNGGRFYPRGDINDYLFEVNPEKSLGDLILKNETRAICEEIIEEQHRAELLKSYNIEPRNRILLTGAPGNGKTTLAEAIAGQLMLPFLVVRYENIIGSFLGETATRLQKVFEYVSTRRCVLFFDEFDTIGKERGDTKETGEIKRVVSSLLLQMDRLPSYVMVITASNHSELLDSAVWRRFQIRLNLPIPTIKQIEEFIVKFEIKSNFQFNYSAKSIATKLKGLSFAEIEEFCIDVLRQTILTQKQNNPQIIVNQKLKQWEARSKVNLI